MPSGSSSDTSGARTPKPTRGRPRRPSTHQRPGVPPGALLSGGLGGDALTANVVRLARRVAQANTAGWGYGRADRMQFLGQLCHDLRMRSGLTLEQVTADARRDGIQIDIKVVWRIEQMRFPKDAEARRLLDMDLLAWLLAYYGHPLTEIWPAYVAAGESAVEAATGSRPVALPAPSLDTFGLDAITNAWRQLTPPERMQLASIAEYLLSRSADERVFTPPVASPSADRSRMAAIAAHDASATAAELQRLADETDDDPSKDAANH